MGLRVEFDLFTEAAAPCEIRVVLKTGERAVSEMAAVAVKPDQDLVDRR